MPFSPLLADSLLEGLMDDVRRYDSFGVHRYGSPGAERALEWIADELEKAGFAVARQRFTMQRQYELRSGMLSAGGRRLDVVPKWWMPESAASFRLTAAFGPGGFERLTLPFDGGAYLNEGHRGRLAQSFACNPRAVLLTIDHPSGEIFTYNIDEGNPPWPVPLILVAPKHRAELDAAQQGSGILTVEIDGRYRHDVPGCNIVARLSRGKGKWLVISTPVTSWFTSTGERGPGIAAFLALARAAVGTLSDVDLLFVATAGHEIGHGGMAHFLKDGAPASAETVAWAHLGSSLACHGTVAKAICSSISLAAVVERHFAGIEATRLIGQRAAIGELREVHAARYENFFGMAGSHKYFHTPADSMSSLSNEMLAQVTRRFGDMLTALARTAK
jgi:hypothetical protein